MCRTSLRPQVGIRCFYGSSIPSRVRSLSSRASGVTSGDGWLRRAWKGWRDLAVSAHCYQGSQARAAALGDSGLAGRGDVRTYTMVVVTGRNRLREIGRTVVGGVDLLQVGDAACGSALSALAGRGQRCRSGAGRAIYGALVAAQGEACLQDAGDRLHMWIVGSGALAPR